MKKFFVSLLAVAGLISGFSLSSCGGGGGSGSDGIPNLSGRKITAVANQTAYTIEFGDKLGTGYHAVISDVAGRDFSTIVMSITGIETGTTEDDEVNEDTTTNNIPEVGGSSGKKNKLKNMIIRGSIASSELSREGRKTLYMIMTGFDTTNPNVTQINMISGPYYTINLQENYIHWKCEGTWSGIADHAEIVDAEIYADRRDPVIDYE